MSICYVPDCTGGSQLTGQPQKPAWGLPFDHPEMERCLDAAGQERRKQICEVQGLVSQSVSGEHGGLPLLTPRMAWDLNTARGLRLVGWWCGGEGVALWGRQEAAATGFTFYLINPHSCSWPPLASLPTHNKIPPRSQHAATGREEKETYSPHQVKALIFLTFPWRWTLSSHFTGEASEAQKKGGI